MKILFLIFLHILTIISSKLDEYTIFKALACVNIVASKFQNEEPDASVLSPLILTCFIKITDDQAQRLTAGIESGEDMPLSDEEIRELTDTESLKEMDQDEVKEKGEQLEESIKQFQKLQEDFLENRGGDDDYDDDGYDDGEDDFEFGGERNNLSKKGFFKLITKSIYSIGETLISSWYIIFFLFAFYIILLEIRRNNNPENEEGNEDKEEKEEDKDDNENKKDEKDINEEKDIRKVKEEKEEKEEKEKEIIENGGKSEDNKKEKED